MKAIVFCDVGADKCEEMRVDFPSRPDASVRTKADRFAPGLCLRKIVAAQRELIVAVRDYIMVGEDDMRA
jgi:hypothetical protein